MDRNAFDRVGLQTLEVEQDRHLGAGSLGDVVEGDAGDRARARCVRLAAWVGTAAVHGAVVAAHRERPPRHVTHDDVPEVDCIARNPSANVQVRVTARDERELVGCRVTTRVTCYAAGMLC